MNSSEFVQALEESISTFKQELANSGTTLPVNALELAKTAYEAIRDTRNHAREMASRILTAMAFFTAAAIALYVAIYNHNPGESTERLELAKAGLSVYLVATLIGSLFYLSTLWPLGPVWKKDPQNNDKFAFSFKNLNSDLKFVELAELTNTSNPSFENILVTDFLRERKAGAISGFAVGRQLQVGSFMFIIAFEGILLLLAAHLYSTRKEGLLAFTVMTGLLTAFGAFGAWLRTQGESTFTRGTWTVIWLLGTILSIGGYYWVQTNM